MISEFQQLYQKIEQLALLAHQMRSENAQLRLLVTGLRADNEAANARMRQASERVAALLAQLPPELQDETLDAENEEAV